MTPPLNLEHSVEFAENPEPRCPCVVMLDTSASMQGAPLAALSSGMQAFRDELARDPIASHRVEICALTFDSEVRIAQPFVTADRFEPPSLTAQGFTYMGTAILRALDALENRKALYRANGIAYYRPWVLMITDGGPQGEPPHLIHQAAATLRMAEQQKQAAFWAVGVKDADMRTLSQIAVRPPLKLRGLDFTQMFLWLSTSMQLVARVGAAGLAPVPLGDVPGQVALPSAA